MDWLTLVGGIAGLLSIPLVITIYTTLHAKQVSALESTIELLTERIQLLESQKPERLVSEAKEKIELYRTLLEMTKEERDSVRKDLQKKIETYEEKMREIEAEREIDKQIERSRAGYDYRYQEQLDREQGTLWK